MTARPTRSTILSAALVLLLSGCAGSTSSSGGAPSAASAVSSAAQTGQHSARAGDVAFAQMMIPHHQQAIAMADLALRDSAGASARVRALAQEVKAAQDPEIQTMTRWLQQWQAPAADASMGHGMRGMMSDEQMRSLEGKTGTDFDRAWLAMMIEHHQGAVSMADDVLATTQNAEVKRLATDVVRAQRQEIATMQSLLK